MCLAGKEPPSVRNEVEVLSPRDRFAGSVRRTENLTLEELLLQRLQVHFSIGKHIRPLADKIWVAKKTTAQPRVPSLPSEAPPTLKLRLAGLGVGWRYAMCLLWATLYSRLHSVPNGTDKGF
jgi:hypothetical protein